MSLDEFVRFYGLFLMIGGLLATSGWMLFAVFDPMHARTTDRFWVFSNLLIIFGGVFMALGLPGFYLAQADRVGIAGVLGFVMLFVGITVPYVAVHSIETTTAPDVPARMMLLVAIGAPSLLIGALLVGFATFSSGIYPKWLAVALIISVLLGLIPQIRTVSDRYSRGVIPALLTTVMAIVGLYNVW